jgi:Cys-tRNA(Pro)/Cys-tRNA(Cys) deacylase
MTLPAQQFLDQQQIPYRKLSFPPKTDKGAANVARALGFRERQMVKTLIFVTGAGEPVLVMLGGDQNAISGSLKRALGDRNVRLAPPERVREVTGYEIGSIPPFHWQPAGFRSFLEATLLEEQELGVGAGVWGQEIIITPKEVVRAASAQVVNLTVRDQPVFPKVPG